MFESGSNGKRPRPSRLHSVSAWSIADSGASQMEHASVTAGREVFTGIITINPLLAATHGTRLTARLPWCVRHDCTIKGQRGGSRLRTSILMVLRLTHISRNSNSSAAMSRLTPPTKTTVMSANNTGRLIQEAEARSSEVATKQRMAMYSSCRAPWLSRSHRIKSTSCSTASWRRSGVVPGLRHSLINVRMRSERWSDFVCAPLKRNDPSKG